MIDTTRPTVERTLRLAVTNRHITPAIERLALAILERAETAESQREALILMAEGADAERDALQAEVARLRAAIKTVTETNDAFKRREIFNTDGTHSKHDRCIHGEPAYNDCAQCICEYLEAALEGKP
jgi:hypothetical protein